MDLRLGATVPATDEERAAIASALGPAGTGWEGGQRTAADGHIAYGGPAPPAVPPADAYGVASFYALFRTTPSPGAVVHVCDDLACQVNGAEELCERMTGRFGKEGSEAAFDGAGVTWQRSP